MSVRKRRCLLVVSSVAWFTWAVAFTASMMVDVGDRHILMQYAVLAVAVVGSIVYALWSASTMIVASLRAIQSTRQQLMCDTCQRRARIKLVQVRQDVLSES